MARKGENIRKRKDGRWEGRYIVLENGNRKTKSVYARSYRDVKKKLLEKKSSMLGKEGQMPQLIQNETEGKITLNQIATEWLYDFSRSCKHATYIKYKNVYEQHIQPVFGNECLPVLTNEYIKNHMKPTLSQSLSRSVYSVLNHISAYGAQKYHMEERKYGRTSVHGTKRPMDTLDISEQTRLIKYLNKDTDVYKLGIYICLSTGLRLGEVCALKWCDIDMELKLLHVNQTVQRLSIENSDSKTVLMETTPKSFCSKREIPLSNQLHCLLKEFQSKNVYVLNGDSPMEPRTLQYKFEKYLSESGIRKTNFHTLRHTFATNCIQMGADVKSVSEVLGHSDVKITLNRYVHPSMDTKREHMNSLSAIYGQINGQ